MTKINEKIILFFIIIISLCFIFFVIGILIGNGKNNINNLDCSLTNIIDNINEKNKANFTCSCVSSNPRMITFTFDSNKINEGYFWD